MKKAVTDMVDFIIDFPEALYLEIYGFILDFLLKFGVDSDVVIDAIMRTQTRRRKYQHPASVLVLRKANRLGKGRKEFLQMRLLESPEQTYRPIVPIIEEPAPVRQLRNRRTGCVDDSRTPCSTSTELPHTASSIQHTRVPERMVFPVDSNGLICAVKRKLFVDDDNAQIPVNSKPVQDIPRTHRTITTGQCQYVGQNGNRKILRKQKRFYKRRDSNTIEKPFACSICPDRSFAYKGNLVLHMKKKHSGPGTGKARTKRQENLIPAFSCPVCLQGYASKYRCKAHIERHHPEVEDWDPISNIDSIHHIKTKTKQDKKKGRNIKRLSRKILLKSTRKSVVPLSETQISSLEYKKASQLRSSSKSYSRPHFTKKEIIPIQFPNRAEISIKFDPLLYSNLNNVRTRQQFRAAFVK